MHCYFGNKQKGAIYLIYHVSRMYINAFALPPMILHAEHFFKRNTRFSLQSLDTHKWINKRKEKPACIIKCIFFRRGFGKSKYVSESKRETKILILT